jgi:DNA (cytosine-5)-methyltransferase 1
MKYFSMFSGIGGFELGIENATRNIMHSKGGGSAKHNTETRVGYCVGYSEIDKYAIATYQSHFGGHRNYGDATKINARELPDFDLLVGGFPCQAFSIAGKRHGFDDTRGTLFFDIARICAEKRPRHLVLENVKGLLSHDSGKTFTTIIGILADLGYFVEWQILNSKNFGVPQNRERVFIVGHIGGEPRRKVFPIFGTDGQNFEPGQTSTTINSGGGGQGAKTGLYAINQRIRRLTPLECERLQGFPDGWTIGSDAQRYKQCGNAVTVNVVEAVMKGLLCD